MTGVQTCALPILNGRREFTLGVAYSLLLAYEDKTYPAALIASLSIPWGESRGDNDEGGYHYIWTRDMINSAMGLLAAGNKITPLRGINLAHNNSTSRRPLSSEFLDRWESILGRNSTRTRLSGKSHVPRMPDYRSDVTDVRLGCPDDGRADSIAVRIKLV